MLKQLAGKAHAFGAGQSAACSRPKLSWESFAALRQFSPLENKDNKACLKYVQEAQCLALSVKCPSLPSPSLPEMEVTSAREPRTVIITQEFSMCDAAGVPHRL